MTSRKKAINPMLRTAPRQVQAPVSVSSSASPWEQMLPGTPKPSLYDLKDKFVSRKLVSLLLNNDQDTAYKLLHDIPTQYEDCKELIFKAITSKKRWRELHLYWAYQVELHGGIKQFFNHLDGDITGDKITHLLGASTFSAVHRDIKKTFAEIEFYKQLSTCADKDYHHAHDILVKAVYQQRTLPADFISEIIQVKFSDENIEKRIHLIADNFPVFLDAQKDEPETYHTAIYYLLDQDEHTIWAENLFKSIKNKKWSRRCARHETEYLTLCTQKEQDNIIEQIKQWHADRVTFKGNKLIAFRDADGDLIISFLTQRAWLTKDGKEEWQELICPLVFSGKRLVNEIPIRNEIKHQLPGLDKDLLKLIDKSEFEYLTEVNRTGVTYDFNNDLGQMTNLPSISVTNSITDKINQDIIDAKNCNHDDKVVTMINDYGVVVNGCGKCLNPAVSLEHVLIREKRDKSEIELLRNNEDSDQLDETDENLIKAYQLEITDEKERHKRLKNQLLSWAILNDDKELYTTSKKL